MCTKALKFSTCIVTVFFKFILFCFCIVIVQTNFNCICFLKMQMYHRTIGINSLIQYKVKFRLTKTEAVRKPWGNINLTRHREKSISC